MYCVHLKTLKTFGSLPIKIEIFQPQQLIFKALEAYCIPDKVKKHSKGTCQRGSLVKNTLGKTIFQRNDSRLDDFYELNNCFTKIDKC